MKRSPETVEESGLPIGQMSFVVGSKHKLVNFIRGTTRKCDDRIRIDGSAISRTRSLLADVALGLPCNRVRVQRCAAFGLDWHWAQVLYIQR